MAGGRRVGVVALGLVVGCAGVTWPAWRHDLQAALDHRAVRGLPWPDGALLGTRVDQGLVWCCSNHCDERIVAASAAPAEVLADAFAGASPEVEIVPREALGTYWEEEGHEGPLLEAFAADHPGTRALVVWRTQSYDSLDLLDPRCH